ncbi:hypothetical protein [Mucilaginibacter rubeus]|uniref:hypothetical protein n=1 Tax=Mucilaginibacter rubeus TaxID=2027860 RepID=UPI001FB71F4E|nr:hypothetical protein [Mucilaginibacter rubeus]
MEARLDGDWYCRVTSDNLFKIAKPTGGVGIGIGIDAFPPEIKNSKILTGNNLGLLGLVETLPSDEEVADFSQTDEMKELVDTTIDDTRALHLHLKAKQLLDDGRVIDALKVLLM